MTLPAIQVLRRYALAALIAWLLPSYAVLAAMFVEAWLTEDWAPKLLPELVVVGPQLGLILGWPCFLFGGAAWVMLHRAGRAGPAYAMLIGAAAPLLPIGYLVIMMRQTSDDATSLISFPLLFSIVAIGAVTGLAVWGIAYAGAPRHPN